MSLPHDILDNIGGAHLWFVDEQGVRHAVCIDWSDPHWTPVLCSLTREDLVGCEPPDEALLLDFKGLPKSKACPQCTVLLEQGRQRVSDKLRAVLELLDGLSSRDRLAVYRYLSQRSLLGVQGDQEADEEENPHHR